MTFDNHYKFNNYDFNHPLLSREENALIDYRGLYLVDAILGNNTKLMDTITLTNKMLIPIIMLFDYQNLHFEICPVTLRLLNRQFE